MRVHRHHVKMGYAKTVKKHGTVKTGGALLDKPSNLEKLRSSLKALSIGGKRPRYISF